MVQPRSTWKEDEEALKQAFEEINDQNLKLIIAPHEIEQKRIDELKNLFPAANVYSNLKTSNLKPQTSNICAAEFDYPKF